MRVPSSGLCRCPREWRARQLPVPGFTPRPLFVFLKRPAKPERPIAWTEDADVYKTGFSLRTRCPPRTQRRRASERNPHSRFDRIQLTDTFARSRIAPAARWPCKLANSVGGVSQGKSLALDGDGRLERAASVPGACCPLSICRGSCQPVLPSTRHRRMVIRLLQARMRGICLKFPTAACFPRR